MDEETLRKRACKLAKHKYLATLYKTLVGKNVLTATEFWEEYGKDIDVKKSATGQIQGMSNAVLETTMTNTHWSLYSAFKEERDRLAAENNDDENGGNKDKKTIHLTAEKILEIFIHLPEVKLAYEKNVPFNFSEKEFWTAFLQSHYFKRATTDNRTSGISDKETQMDKLLKKYTQQVELEKSRENKTGSPSPGINSKINDKNTFASQLNVIQTQKNKEVDVEGKLRKMKEDIARARAEKNGDIGDMKKFVDSIESGDIGVMNGDGELVKNGKVNINIGDGKDLKDDGDIEMVDKNGSKSKQKLDEDGRIEANKPLKRRNFKRKLKVLDPSIDLTATMASFTEIIEDPGIDNDANKDRNRDDIQQWFNQVNKHGTMLLYQSLNQRSKKNDNRNNTKNVKEKDKGNIQEIMSNVPKVNYGKQYNPADVYNDDDDEDEDDDIKMTQKKDNEEEKDQVCLFCGCFYFEDV